MSNNSDPIFEKILSSLRNLDPSERRKAFLILKREREEKVSEGRQDQSILPNSHFSKRYMLQRLSNPAHEAYEQKIHLPEFTFIGVLNQPDFGEVLLTFYPNKWTIELKSLKVYKDAYRDVPISYERLSNVMFDDLMTAYEPTRLRLMMRLRPRGGIASCLTIDSDWKIRGGNEQFQDWTHNTDQFGFHSQGSTKI